MPPTKKAAGKRSATENLDALALGDVIKFRPFKTDVESAADIRLITNGQYVDIYRKAVHLGLQAMLNELHAYATSNR